MLEQLTLRNFRGFDNHRIPLRNPTVVVGKNNAGKSTIVEALRLVAITTARYAHLAFRNPPEWLELPLIMRGVSPSLSFEEYDFKTAFHRYNDPPAEIVATFANRTGIHIYIGGEGVVHAVILDAEGSPVPDRARALQLGLPRVAILPQIAPLVHEEERLTPEYVQRTIDTPLTSLHFRNQLWLDAHGFRRFKKLVEETWPGVRVTELDIRPATYGPQGLDSKSRFSLLVQNDDFVAEASYMGHGLQMWLQIMWFLARTSRNAVVILDEPDVYMHPDLQRRLVRLVTHRFAQAIVATHSTEIMADVDPDNVLVVERSRPESGFASSLPAVQSVIDALGSVHNLHLARLWTTKRFLILEGDDIDILGPLHATLFPESGTPLQTLPHGDVGGWSGWERAIGAAAAMRNAVGDPITVYALFDSDYQSKTTIRHRYKRAGQEQIQLHVWQRKEIENYLLVPTAVARFICERTRARQPSALDVATEVDAIAERLRTATIAPLTTSIQSLKRRTTAGTAFLKATREVDKAWRTQLGRWSIVGGKAVLAALSEWSKRTYGVSFSATSIARCMTAAEVPTEVGLVLGAIESRERIDDKARAAAQLTQRPQPGR